MVFEHKYANFLLLLLFFLQTLQAEASLEGIQVNHMLLLKWMHRRNWAENARKLIPHEVLKKCRAFAPADLRIHGIISEQVYVCAVEVRCVLWVGDRTWYCAQRRELALLCKRRKVWTSSLSFRRVSKGERFRREIMVFVGVVVGALMTARRARNLIDWVFSGVRLWV